MVPQRSGVKRSLSPLTAETDGHLGLKVPVGQISVAAKGFRFLSIDPK